MEGLRVGVTAGRQGHVLTSALARRGAEVLWGPTVAGDRAADDAEAAVARLLAVRPQWVVASTGMAVRSALEAAEAAGCGDAFRELLRGARVAARGVKAHGALRALGVEPVFVSAHETDADTADWLARHVLPGERVGVLAHGADDGEAYAAVIAAGAMAVLAHPYRSSAPEDTGPALALVDALCAGRLDAVLCTSPNAFRNLLVIGGQAGRGAALLAALRADVAMAAIGGVTARAMEAEGVPVTVMPLRPRTAELLRALDSWSRRGGRVASGPVRLLPAAHRAAVPSGEVALGDREFALLAALVRRPEVVCPPEVLAVEVWGHAAPGDALAVKHLVSRVRRKLGAYGTSLETVRSVGYRYAPYAVSAA